MSQKYKKLDVSKASECQRKEILRYATETRRFEIERFWQRSIFFWGFIGAAFVAYGALAGRGVDPLLPLVIACFGIVSSVAWALQNRGSKYWQEAWEDKIKSVEIDVLGADLFTNIEPPRKQFLWSSGRYSVSKLAIALSDFTVFVWVVLVWKAFPLPDPHICISAPTIFVILTGAYVLLLAVLGRSKPPLIGPAQ
jgi:hypothetical protein